MIDNEKNEGIHMSKQFTFDDLLATADSAFRFYQNHFPGELNTVQNRKERSHDFVCMLAGRIQAVYGVSEMNIFLDKLGFNYLKRKEPT